MTPSPDGPPRRATASAPANIAFVKYWGATDLERVVPWHPSISMTLEVCRSHSTVEVRDDLAEDQVRWREEDGSSSDPGEAFSARVVAHLERLRAWAGPERIAPDEHFRVITRNTFPAAAGLASSASGFSALTVATLEALGIATGGDAPAVDSMAVDPATLSVLARRSGSGSATRSVLGGYVQWPAAPDDGPPADDDNRAVQLHGADHWDLRDVIALVETGPKDVPSLGGHRLATTSPHFERRRTLVPERLETVRRALAERDLDLLGPVLEEDAIELHAVAMTSEPAIFYWQPPTLAVLAAVRRLRRDGVAAWSTMDAGANVHVITTPEHEAPVAERLATVAGVTEVIRDRVGTGPRVEGGEVEV